MATRIRDFDWVTTPLGPIECWPPSLRAIVDLMLASDVVMSVMWGRQAVQIFNDAYANAVAERHPAALGGSALETFGDFRPIFEPLFQRAMSGSTSTLQNLRYQFPTSHQSLGEVWFDLTYTPIRTDGSTVAGVLAILSDATARVRAEQVLQQGEERQAFLLALSDALRSLDDAADIQEAACRLLGEHLGTDRTDYVEIDDERGLAIVLRDYVRGDAPSLAGSHPLASFSAVLEPQRSGFPFACDDAAVDPRISDIDRAAYLERAIRSFLTVPLVRAGELVATMSISVDRPRHWTEAEIALQQDVAERTWVSVARAQAEAALRTNDERMRAQKEAFQAAINGAPLGESLEILARMATDEMAGEARTAFYIADQDGHHLRPVRGAGNMPASYLDQVDGFVIGMDSLACGLAVASACAVLTRDVFDEPRWKSWLHLAREYGFRGRWSFPIETRDGRPVGTFAMYFATPRDASALDLARAEAVTQAAAIILARHAESQERTRAEIALRESEASLQHRIATATAELRSLSRRLLEVQEEERRFLARELHDEIGQMLTALQIQLATLEREPRPNGNQALEQSVETVRELTTRVSEISMDLRPSTLDTLGLLPALLTHIERYQDRTGIAVEMRHHGLDRRFPTRIETTAYRVVQEALTNIARHANAARVTVQFLVDEETMTIVIRDNGRGFILNGTADAGGLSGMRERAELLNGTWSIETVLGAGTVVTAELPLSSSDGNGSIQ